jgi:hypothetical protein
LQTRAAADQAEHDVIAQQRRVALLEAQLAHLQVQATRAADAERATAAERETTLGELLAARTIDTMRQEAHRREVATLQV